MYVDGAEDSEDTEDLELQEALRRSAEAYRKEEREEERRVSLEIQEALRRSAEEQARREREEEQMLSELSACEFMSQEEKREEDERQRALEESLHDYERRQRSEEQSAATQSLREHADGEHAALVRAVEESALEVEVERKRREKEEEMQEKEVLQRSIKSWRQEVARRMAARVEDETSETASFENAQEPARKGISESTCSFDEGNLKAGSAISPSHSPPSSPTLALRPQPPVTPSQAPAEPESPQEVPRSSGTWSFEGIENPAEHQDDTSTIMSPEAEVNRAMEEVQISREVDDYIRRKRLRRLDNRDQQVTEDDMGERCV